MKTTELPQNRDRHQNREIHRIEIAICDLKARAQQNLPPMIDKPDKILASETE